MYTYLICFCTDGTAPVQSERTLPGTDVHAVKSASQTDSLVHSGAADLGTQVRERDDGSGTIRVGVVVTGPPAGPKDRQRTDLLARITEANAMFSSMKVPVSVVLCDRTLGAFPMASDVVFELETAHANVGFVIDAALRIQSADLFADLVGIALRSDVFGVSPVVVAPSGVAIDAGLDFDVSDDSGEQSFVARCGPLRRPPYGLLWTRAVGSLSGRCFVGPVRSFQDLGDRLVSAPHLRSAADTSDAKLIVWPHHQVVATYAVAQNVDGNTPAALVWRTPRLMTWFGPNIAAYSPLNDSASESVW